MPTFSRQAPLAPEGEYTGIIKGAGQEVTKKGVVQLKVPIHLPDGRTITTYVRFPDDAHGDIPVFPIHQLVKSTGLEMPDGEGDPQITPDDIEGLQVWFAVKHAPGKDGRVFANVNFHTKVYAISQNPVLASVVLSQARKPAKLRSVLPVDVVFILPPPATPPASNATPAAYDPMASPAYDLKTGVHELDKMTPEELTAFLVQTRPVRAKAETPASQLLRERRCLTP